VTNLTDSINAGLELGDPKSDSYLDWVVIDRNQVYLNGTNEFAVWPANDPDGRVSHVRPGELENGKELAAEDLMVGKFLYAESDSRGGNQEQTVFTPNYDLTGKSNIWVSFHSSYEQNQDSIGVVEYSIDGGTSWLPVLYMLDGPDIALLPDGSVDAVTTLTQDQTDTANGQPYGAFLGAPISQDLAPYISARLNDNNFESKRVELYPLPKAANQSKVKLRFMQAGTGSWYFGIDNVGIYSMSAPVTGGSGSYTNGLVAYWNFDGTLVDSIKDYNGVARGKAPVEFVDSLAGFGKALKLNGTNYVEISNSKTNLQFANGNLSIAGWFKVDKFDKSWQALISKGEDLNYRIARRSDTNSIAYAGGVGEGADDVPNVNDGKWHHFVAISDTNRTAFGTALYLDGVMHSVNTNKPALQAGTSSLFIGENPGALNRQWTGEIDDVALWNRVLTPAEITALYNGGQGTPLSTTPGINSPTALTVSRSGNNVTIGWTPAGGTLESSPALAPGAVWTDAGTANPATVPIGAANAFYRVRK